MAYEIDEIVTGDISSANTVALGGNYRVYISPQNARLIGVVEALDDHDAATGYDADDHGTFEKEGDYTFPNAGAKNVVASVRSTNLTNPSSDDNNPKIILDYTDTTNAADQDGTITFDLPSISEHQDVLFFPRGYSRDVDFGTNDNNVKSIQGLKADTGIQYLKKGSEVGIYALPDLTSFKLIVQTDSFADPSTVSNPISVPAGLNSSRWVAAGMTPEPEITFTQKFVSNSEIVQRLSGRHVTLMVEIYKNDQVLSSRAIYTEAILNWSHDSGEGEAPVMRNSTARFKDALYFFTAP